MCALSGREQWGKSLEPVPARLLLVWLDWGRSLQLAGLSGTRGRSSLTLVTIVTPLTGSGQPSQTGSLSPIFYSWASVLLSLSFYLRFSTMRTKRWGSITTALCQRPLCLQGHWLVDVWCASSVVMTNFFLMWPILRRFFSSSIFCCWLTLWPALCHRKRQARACVDAYTFEYMSTETKSGLVLLLLLLLLGASTFYCKHLSHFVQQ